MLLIFTNCRFYKNLREYKFAYMICIANLYVNFMLRKLIALFWTNAIK